LFAAAFINVMKFLSSIPAVTLPLCCCVIVVTADRSRSSPQVGAKNTAVIQKVSSSNLPDVMRLRSQLASAIDKDIEIVKDEFKQRNNGQGGGFYRLVQIKPKQSGYFALKYT
jgi:hypothetical protein